MRLIGAALAGLFLLGAGQILSIDPPRPGADSPDDYPISAGLRWTYVSSDRAASLTREVEGTGPWLTMHFRVPPLVHEKLVMRRTAGGVVGRREGTDQEILRFPMRPGDSWRIDFPSYPETADCRVLGPETVEFLGRRADAVKLEVVRTARKSGKRLVDYEWYAPGVGLVRMEFTKVLRWTFALTRFERTDRAR